MAVAAYLDLALPEDAAWTTVEHGGKRGKREAGRLKAKGIKAGWPDIIVIHQGRVAAIELKGPNGRLNPRQEAMHERLMLAGAPVYTATRLEEVEGFLRGCGVPLRATTGTRAACCSLPHQTDTKTPITSEG